MPAERAHGLVSSSEPQPGLLEERRAWVKTDRDVKLDIFLSVCDEIKMDVFEVGPPLPPSAMTAREMLGALDHQFAVFSFVDYHHDFCHFLNLHVDQYSSIDEFNSEFLATLDDLADHGIPLDNVQACSAYFSKLRCTQNPWVAKQLQDWEVLDSPPLVHDMIKEVPPWVIVRPLGYRSLSRAPTLPSLEESTSESSSEDLTRSVEDLGHVEVDVHILSDRSSHQSLHAWSREETIVHASVEDLTQAFPSPSAKSTSSLVIPKRRSSMSSRTTLKELKKPLPPLPGSTAKPESPSKRMSALKSAFAKPDLSSQRRSTFTSAPSAKSDPPSQRASTIRPVAPSKRVSQSIPSLSSKSSSPAAPSLTSSPSFTNIPLPATPPVSSPERPTTAPARPPSPPQTPTPQRPPLKAQVSVDTAQTFPPNRLSPTDEPKDSASSSNISLPLQGLPTQIQVLPATTFTPPPTAPPTTTSFSRPCIPFLPTPPPSAPPTTVSLPPLSPLPALSFSPFPPTSHPAPQPSVSHPPSVPVPGPALSPFPAGAFPVTYSIVVIKSLERGNSTGLGDGLHIERHVQGGA